MPAPVGAAMANDVKTFFRAKAIKLSVNWSQPTGEGGKQYGDAFEPSERAVPDSSNRLFVAVSTNKYHVDQCVKVGQAFEQFIDGMSAAICGGWQQWCGMATVVGPLVNAVVAVVTPGNILGPPLFPLIFAQAPKATPMQLKYSMAIGGALGDAWLAWHMGFAGTLNYPPTFATCPSPVHPPTPNLPKPLVAVGKSPGEALLAPPALKGAMMLRLADPMAMHAEPLFDCFAQAIKKAFDMWAGQTQLSSVLGIGPVPTFAPPFVPVGPVVAGVGTAPPGAAFP